MATFELSDAVAEAAATLSQADAVLMLVGDNAELEPTQGSAVFGAATIVREALRQLNKLEVAIGNLERDRACK